MYLNDISEDDFQIKKRKTIDTNFNRTPVIISPNPDMECFESNNLDFVFKKLYTNKKRKVTHMNDNTPSSISKPSKNTNIYYTKYENIPSSISKPNLL